MIIDDNEIEKTDETSEPLLKPEPPITPFPTQQQRVVPGMFVF